MRPGDPAQTIYIVSATRGALASIADRTASPTYFLVVGSPHGVDMLLRSLKFNLVIVLADVPRSDSELIEKQIASLPGGPVLVTDVIDSDLTTILGRHAH